MTEIPEHLLKRSRERREALGLSSGETPAPAGDAPAAATPAEAQPAVAAAAPAPAAPAEPPPPPEPEPVPPYVEAATRRKRMPFWAAPVVVALPLWAVIYVGTLEAPSEEAAGLLAEGSDTYASCAGCHGGGGGGGSGPQLSGGEVLLTFPDLADHVTWVVQGSPPSGTPYGSPDRPGGQRVATGAMPPFADNLTNEQILAVTLHERAALSGSEEDAALAATLDEMIASGEIDLSEDWTTDTTRDEIAEVLAPVLEAG